jgi:hypothetical protein
MREILRNISDLGCDLFHATGLSSMTRPLCSLGSDPYTTGAVTLFVVAFAIFLGYRMLDRFLGV